MPDPSLITVCAIATHTSPHAGIEHDSSVEAQKVTAMQLERSRNKTETIDATGAVGS